LKSELVWRTVFQTRAEAKQAVGRYIDGFYNPSGVTRRSATSVRFSPEGWPDSNQTALH
jgi:putative transposase